MNAAPIIVFWAGVAPPGLADVPQQLATAPAARGHRDLQWTLSRGRTFWEVDLF